LQRLLKTDASYASVPPSNFSRSAIERDSPIHF
jgi:hypothetical protein